MSSLNVKDALEYLDQVKVQFVEQPDVYNRFLDIMKDFKSQAIDTPGVIERVSALFQGHAPLIQGFNTFLPPGYHIDCSHESNMITVTTPTGTMTARGGIGIAGALSRANAAALAGVAPDGLPPPPQQPPAQPASHHPHALSPPMAHVHQRPTAPPHSIAPGPAHTSPALHPRQPQLPYGPGPTGYPIQPTTSGPGYANGNGHPAPGTPGPNPGAPTLAHPPTGLGPAMPHEGSRAPLEFNHAINYVNKIKQRFNSAPDTYRQFLEILQAYQRGSRPIQEVYAEVTQLFGNDKDLLEEFRQFLPDNSQAGGGGAVGGLFGAMAGRNPESLSHGLAPHPAAPTEPAPAPAPAPPRPRASGTKSKKRSAPDAAPAAPSTGTGEPRGKRAKHGYSAAPEAEVGYTQPIPPEETVVPVQPGEPAYAASNDASWYPAEAVFGVPLEPRSEPKEDMLATLGEVALFDRIKRHIDAKAAYTEFLKLLQLFSQDIIDARLLLDQAALFIGDSPDLFGMFCHMVGYDQGKDDWLTNVPPTISNIPVSRRNPVIPGLYKAYGPSYHRLPRFESNLSCSGRDALCWSVLNDSFLSTPLFSSETEGFLPHRKNVYETTLFVSEEERHEFDHHIELNLRTIELLIPLVARFEKMSPAEREVARLPKDLGAASPTIHERVIKKVYGKEAGLEILAAMSEAPAATLPIVLERLKAVDQTWRAGQREWNKVWHEVDLRNFYKSLDHQGKDFKANDKRATTTKAFVAEIEAERARQLAQHQGASRRERIQAVEVGESGEEANQIQAQVCAWPCYQHAVKISDMQVFSDVLKMCFSHFDRTTNYSKPDMERIETFLRSFGSMIFGLDPAEVEAWIAPLRTVDDEEEEVSKGAASERNDSTSDATPPTGDAEPPKLDDVGPTSPTPPPDSSTIDTWMRFGGFTTDQAGTSAARPSAGKSKADLPPDIDSLFFYANTQLFVFVKLFETIYTRLVALKAAAEKRTKVYPSKQRVNPVAVALGLQNPATGPAAVVGILACGAQENPEQESGLFLHPRHYYGTLLQMCERLFDGELDQSSFEEAARFMFDIDAYPIFTVDKVISSLIKAVHNLVTDQRSLALMEQAESFRARTRAAAKALCSYPENERAWVEWARCLIDQRMASEGLVASDENLFRIVWNGPSSLLTYQILGRDELTLPQAATSDRSRLLYYIASYASWYPSEGLPRAATARLLSRNLAVVGQTKTKHVPSGSGSGNGNGNGSGSGPGEAEGSDSSSKAAALTEQVSYTSQHGLKGTIDRRTRRILFEQGQDDVMVRHRPQAELDLRTAGLRASRTRKEARLSALLAQRLEAVPPVPQEDAMDLDGTS